MTAINAFVRGSEAMMLTDAAYLDATGRLIFIGSKVRLMPHANAVCAIRGEGELDSAFTAMLSTAFTSFDGLKAGFREAVENVIASHDKGRGYAPFDLVVAGVSEFYGKPDVLAATRGPVPGPMDIGPWAPWVSPLPDPGMMPGLDATSPGFDPVMNGADLLEAQRRQVIQPPGFPPCHIVGGFAQLTTVSAAGISTRMLKRWPDKVGQRIVP